MGEKLKPEDPLSAVNAGLAKEPVITGRIHYPRASGLEGSEGTGVLVVARSVLWPEVPYPLLSYAVQNPAFPHDGTGDQWFNDGQFTAYTQLGRQLGKRALAAMKPLEHQLLCAHYRVPEGTMSVWAHEEEQDPLVLDPRYWAVQVSIDRACGAGLNPSARTPPGVQQPSGGIPGNPLRAEPIVGMQVQPSTVPEAPA